ncbi:S8 family serine peptidase [Romeria aff. gracilis LEGE 07310]|uniref:S8 family serine peptidase n=1 Tax=Vasconcelosia minhoensis LEGE 07310 TaxID=915328 RepID=A0A8J7AWH9_9CYAN|nr:S8 family serine peptidase [Romeria aff. gracilis LEGE 07310]
MKRLLPWSLLTVGCLVGLIDLVRYPLDRTVAMAQTAADEGDLYYTFYDQRIPLVERTNQIAVEFSPNPSLTRGEQEPAYLRLQRDLQAATQGTRGGLHDQPAAGVEVRPLGNRYALIELPEGTRSPAARLGPQLEQPYIAATLPVLSRPEAEDSIVVTPEIVVSFEPNTTEGQARSLIAQYNLELIRPLRFTEGRYLVRGRNIAGEAVLDAANQLTAVPGIQSATPNFVQSLPYRVAVPDVLGAEPAAEIDLQQVLSGSAETTPYPGSLLPLQWHLNSQPLRPRPYRRTDIRAVEAWEQGHSGEEVVVAVIDSLIQWDHPDLANTVYTLPATVEDPLPGEVSGWDFSNTDLTCAKGDPDSCTLGDPDTRISNAELDFVRPYFQNSFVLSDAALLAAYPRRDQNLQDRYPNATAEQRADALRRTFQSYASSQFHGTWTAGVIAAQPQNGQGIVGVAPEAEFLPVRVFGLGGEITPAALIEAVGYAAAREVDVINLSLGSLLPNWGLTDQMFAVLDRHPDLVIVASAGNDSLDGVGFPAAIPGVIAVGATNLEGNRTAYSSYGAGLDLVAPGGEVARRLREGILTTGGTWVEGFWTGIARPEEPWGLALDPIGQYVSVQGTSFSAPAVSGVLALMKGQDPDRQLSREQLTTILQETASYAPLTLTQADANQYRVQAEVGFGTTLAIPTVRPSGIEGELDPISPEAYYYGRGLVNATAAVEAVAMAVEKFR